MRRGKYGITKRIISMLLSMVLVLAMVPVTGVKAASAVTEGIVKVEADPYTLHAWNTAFDPINLTTEHAGGIWTDKSVLTKDQIAQALPGVNGLTVGDNNFLVALSALAANSVIVGHGQTAERSRARVHDADDIRYNVVRRVFVHDGGFCHGQYVDDLPRRDIGCGGRAVVRQRCLVVEGCHISSSGVWVGLSERLCPPFFFHGMQPETEGCIFSTGTDTLTSERVSAIMETKNLYETGDKT